MQVRACIGPTGASTRLPVLPVIGDEPPRRRTTGHPRARQRRENQGLRGLLSGPLYVRVYHGISLLFNHCAASSSWIARRWVGAGGSANSQQGRATPSTTFSLITCPGRCPAHRVQHRHDVAFHNRYVGIRSTGPPTNQHPTTLLKCLTTREPPSLFDMDGVTYAPGAPPSAMLGIPDQMGQFVCHSFTPLKSTADLRGTPHTNTLRRCAAASQANTIGAWTTKPIAGRGMPGRVGAQARIANSALSVRRNIGDGPRCDQVPRLDIVSLEFPFSIVPNPENPARFSNFGEDRPVTLFGCAHALSPVFRSSPTKQESCRFEVGTSIETGSAWGTLATLRFRPRSTPASDRRSYSGTATRQSKTCRVARV
jgi:hypothetical protein